MNKFLLIFLLLFVETGCSIEVQPIEYGHDQCHYCKMNIVDREHASQYVTSKGKQYKFDAIECLLNDLNDNKKKPAIIRVSDYGHSAMTEAKKATYLISPGIKSPMGENLSAFASKEEAEKMLSLHKGNLYSWEEIKKRVKKKDPLK